MTEDHETALKDFFNRSVAANKATGVPQPFEVATETTVLESTRKWDESRPVATQPLGKQALAPPRPGINSCVPDHGPTAGGTPVIIGGDGFIATSIVKFDDIEGTGLVFNSPQQLSVRTPAHAASSVDVKVINSADFTSTLSRGFTYADGVLTTPSYGDTIRPTYVNISNGVNFAAGTTVKFGGVDATDIVIVNGSSLNCYCPAHFAGPVTVVVHNTVGADQSGAFLYQAAPNNHPYGMSFFFPNPGDPAFWPAMFEGNYNVQVQAYRDGQPYSTFNEYLGPFMIVGTTNIASVFVTNAINVIGGQGFFNIGAVLIPGFAAGEIRIQIADQVYFDLYTQGMPFVNGRGDGIHTHYITVYRI